LATFLLFTKNLEKSQVRYLGMITKYHNLFRNAKSRFDREFFLEIFIFSEILCLFFHLRKIIESFASWLTLYQKLRLEKNVLVKSFLVAKKMVWFPLASRSFLGWFEGFPIGTMFSFEL
jgi:hypothetical protein